MAISVPPISTQPQIPGAWVWLSTICMAHIVVHYVLTLNRTVHICVYLLLPSPVYSPNIPITSFPLKGFIIVPVSPVLTSLV